MAEHSTIGERERRKWNRGVLYCNNNHMDVALMSRPTEFKAGLPEDFSGKNDDTT